VKLPEYYISSFKAAVDAEENFMNSFNELNEFLQQEIDTYKEKY
jgi:hypothetical protein